MTLADTASAPRPLRPGPATQVLADITAAAPVLSGLTVVLALLTLPTLAAMALDPRIFQGTSIWLKPLKFELALAIYTGTLALYALWVPPRVRSALWFRAVTATATLAILAEIAWIGGAAAAGTASHFNLSSPLMAALYNAAGIGAVTLTSLTLVFGVAIARNAATGLPPSFHLSLCVGLLLTFVLTLVTAGTMASMSGHTVGASSSDAGLAFFGWSREAGDLRVAHFFATHAMHAVPLIGLFAAALLDAGAGRRVVWAAGAAYAAFVLFTFMEALAGRPFLSVFV